MTILQPTSAISHYAGLRSRSLQLAKFLRNDFSEMPGEIGAAFPSLRQRLGIEQNAVSLYERIGNRTSRRGDGDGSVPLRFLPIARRVSRELGTLYKAPARRVWSGVGQDAATNLIEMYRQADIDDLFDRTLRSLVLQQTQHILVLPGGPLGFRCLRLDPHELEVIPGNPLFADDIQQAKCVRYQYPARVDSQNRHFAVMEMTRDGIWWEGQSGDGPFGAGGPNPFGQSARPFPIITLRAPGIDPEEGEYYAPVNEPVLQAQIAVNLALTDIERIVRHDAHGYKIIIPGNEGNVPAAQAEEIVFATDTVLALPGIGTDFKIVGGQMAASIQAYVQLIQRRLEWLAVFLDISPDALMKSNAAKTAVSRKFDRLDREENRQEYEPIFRRAERELYAEIRRVSAVAERPVAYPDAERVSVRFGDMRTIPADPLAEAQAARERQALGIESAEEVVARERGISLLQARAIVRANLGAAGAAAPQEASE